MKLKVPTDLDQIIADIKVCGRAELSKLLTLRHKFQVAFKAQNKSETVQAVAKVDTDEEIEKELDEAIKRREREQKR